MRLIDADELLEHKFISASERMDLSVAYMGGWNDAIDSINENAPTVDAEPIRHGKWEHGREVAREFIGSELVSIDYEDYHCSVCGAKFKNRNTVIPFKFCPFCGAKMNEEDTP